MMLPDLLHSLTVAGFTLRRGQGEAIDVLGDVAKLTPQQVAGLKEHKPMLLAMLTTTCHNQQPSETELERDAIRFADTKQADAPLADALNYFEQLCHDMRTANPEALAGVALEPEPQPIPCRRCNSQQTYLAQIHDGASLRRDCAECGRFVGFPVWQNVTQAGEILAHTATASRYDKRRAAQVVEHPSSSNVTTLYEKEQR